MFTALSIATNGAGGDTSKQMKSVLGINTVSNEKLNEGMNNLINNLNLQENSINPGFTKIYNSLWFDENLAVKDSFVKTSKDYYDSDVMKENFNTPDALNDMNSWIDEKSDGSIKNPIVKIEPNTQFYIFNVVQFSGKWTDEFSTSLTKKENPLLK